MKELTQEEIDKVFDSELGRQCDILYSTSDGRIFVRYQEALSHTEGELDGTEPLEDKLIQFWFPKD